MGAALEMEAVEHREGEGERGEGGGKRGEGPVHLAPLRLLRESREGLCEAPPRPSSAIASPRAPGRRAACVPVPGRAVP